MPTERPLDRVHRRLGGDPGLSDSTAAPDDPDDDPTALVPRWLPAPEPEANGTLAGWLATARADPGRAGGIALAVVAALAVLVTVFTLIRDDTPPVSSAKLPPVQMVSSSSAVPSTVPPGMPTGTSAAPDRPVVVSVVGLVQTPGLVTVTPGARVADVITAAGGVTGPADTLGLNMARHVADGEQVVVGIAPAPGAAPTLGSSVTGSGPAGTETNGAAAATVTAPGPLDLNSATVGQLEELPGIGPVTAAAIVAWRDQNGAFRSVDQLAEVNGIGPARLQKLRDLVRV